MQIFSDKDMAILNRALLHTSMPLVGRLTLLDRATEAARDLGRALLLEEAGYEKARATVASWRNWRVDRGHKQQRKAPAGYRGFFSWEVRGG